VNRSEKSEGSSYRDLVVKQRAMELCVASYLVTKRLPPHENCGLVSQIHGAAVSVPANIAEGHGRRYLGIICTICLSPTVPSMSWKRICSSQHAYPNCQRAILPLP
jgi:hypothetical protein